jgi:hypothetical protein
MLHGQAKLAYARVARREEAFHLLEQAPRREQRVLRLRYRRGQRQARGETRRQREKAARFRGGATRASGISTPSCCILRMASRTGVRLTFNLRAHSMSFRRWPDSISPLRIFSHRMP